MYEDVDISIEAAQRAVDVKASQDEYRALSESLNAKAFWLKGEEQGKLFSRAEKAARSALVASHNPAPKTFYDLADVLENEGSCAEAEQFFRSALNGAQVLRDITLEANSLRGLTRCTFRLNKFEASQESFDKLLATGETSFFDWDSQAERLETLQKLKEAAAAREAAARAGGGYTEWCMAAADSSVTPDDDGTLSAARSCIDKGTGVAGSEKALAIAHEDIAEILNQRGVYLEALNHAREATALDNSRSFAYNAMGSALLGLHRPEEAVTSFQQAIRLSDGKYSFMHFNLGSAYFDLENWTFARDSFEKSAELNPKDAPSAYNVALCFIRMNYKLDAAKWYEEYLRRNPSASDAAQIRATIRRLRGSD
ncbi:MAG: tetratricopeptide repeat protein [Candidatus Acidiferrales bacterium]